MISPIAASKSEASRFMSLLRSACCRCVIADCSTRIRSVSIMPVLNTSTAPAISPISSWRPTPGIFTAASPLAIRVIALAMARIALEMPWPIRSDTALTMTSARPSVIGIHCFTAAALSASELCAASYRSATSLPISVMTGSISAYAFDIAAPRRAVSCASSVQETKSDWYFASFCAMSAFTVGASPASAMVLANFAAVLVSSPTYFWSRRR
jgi:hypothetical protein